MDFGTYLKQELGYQSGQFIPQREAQALQAKYNKYIQDEEQKLKSADAEKAKLTAANIETARVLKEREVAGVPATPDEIAAASELAKTGQSPTSFISGPLVSKQAEDAKRLQKEEEERKRNEVKLAGSEAALRAASDASYAIKEVNKLASSPGLSGVFGAKWGTKWWPGSQARDAEASRRAIVSLATTDSMRKFQGLGSMSDAEFAVAKSAATKLEDTLISDEMAAQELNRLRDYFSTSIRRAEELGRIPKGTSDKMINEAMAGMTGSEASITGETATPKTETELLRANIK
jgi:hypothetical protein